MVGRNEIPHLVALLEDESPNVREQILRELRSYDHAELEDELNRLRSTLSRRQVAALEEMIAAQRGEAARWDAWRQWPALQDEYEQLETAMDLLARFQYGWEPPEHVGELLDDLAGEFKQSGRPVNAIELSRFLFDVKELRGNSEDYYNPLNSNVIHAIQEKTGLPITLSIIFMLVGKRVGLIIHGCNMPSHFLTRTPMDGVDEWFDCYSGGRKVSQAEMERLSAMLTREHEHLLTQAPTTIEIVARVLRNLINGYDLDKDLERRALFEELLHALHETSSEVRDDN